MGLVPTDDITLRVVQHEAHRIARTKGWYDNGPRSIGDVLAAVHSEVSEAWQEYRTGCDPAKIRYEADHKPQGFGIECADAIIIISDITQYLGIDLTYCVQLKMDYNATRPHRHGNKLG